MSRIGKKPVSLPAGVKVSVSGQQVTVEKGSNRLSLSYRPQVQVKVDEAARSVVVSAEDQSRTGRALHGLTRALIQNMVLGVSQGFTKELEFTGVGWTIRVQGTTVQLNVGYADTRVLPIPPGVKVEVSGARIKVSGTDKQQVGQMAADIRRQRPPELYNGKGIKYVDEHVVRKQGKAFAGGGAA